MEFRLRGGDGVYRWFLTQVTPIRDSSGAIKHWFGARTNIHEQREIRRALEETQERLVLAQKASHCGSFDFDAATGVNVWSDELQRMYGFLPGAFSGTCEAWLDCVLPEDRAIAEEPFRSCESNEFETEFRIERRDNGEIRWINSRGRIRRDTAGKPVRIIGLHIDMTRMKRAEEELKRAHDDLEALVLARTSELRIAEDRLRRLSGRLMQSQDDERRRIARELHDGLGQYLVASKMSLDLLSMTLSHDSRAIERLADATKQIETAISETRTISHLLHPPLLDEVGLESALVWYAEGFAKRSSIAVDVDIAPSIGRLPTDVETALFRVVQECLTNVHRHSASATASVRLFRVEGGDLTLEVSDQGVGVPANSPVPDSARPAPGVGLQGIRERVLQLHGKMDLISGEGKGTRVVVTLPGAAQGGVPRESVERSRSLTAE